MNCCPCCVNTLNLGCLDPCGLTFETGSIVMPGEDGIWMLKLQFKRRCFNYEADLVEGDPIRFDVGQINENFTYTATIIKPDGTVFTKEVDGIVYDCFKFTTKIGA